MTEEVFVTQLSTNAGISVSGIVWVTTFLRYNIKVAIFELMTDKNHLTQILQICLRPMTSPSYCRLLIRYHYHIGS